MDYNISNNATSQIWETIQQQYQTNFEVVRAQSFTEQFNKIDRSSKPSSTQPIKLEASGSHAYASTGTTLQLGDTGLTMQVSDLHISSTTRNTVGKLSQPYDIPSYIEAGQVTITGTSDKDTIDLSQNDAGDTLLVVKQGGKEEAFNLGQIAAVTINAGGGNDRITLSAENYFGGITINGEGGADLIRVNADNTLAEGINVQGGDDDDSVYIQGNAGKLNINGSGGNDQLYANNFNGIDRLLRKLYGGAGDDILFGTLQADQLYGNDGDDTLRGIGGDNQIYGGAGNDFLFGASGNDTMYGEAGSDTLVGNQGQDLLLAGDDDDFLYIGQGQTALGGAGVDNFILGTLTPHTLYATDSNGSYLQVIDNNITKHQALVPDHIIKGYQLNLADYDESEDYLVDQNYIA